MNCKDCGAFFQPPPEEEKLITTGGLPVLCHACERRRWKERTPPEDRVPLYPGMQPKITTGIELYRAARFNSDGVELLFVALPEKPRKPSAAPLRKTRKDEAAAHVFIMSEYRSQGHTVPRTQLLTNFTTYEKYGSDLTVSKVPDCWDPFTGVGNIVVRKDEIVNVEHSETLIRIVLTDGGWVSLYYR